MIGYLSLFFSLFIIDHVKLNNGLKLKCAFFVITLFSALRYGIGFDYFMYYDFIEQNVTNTNPIPCLLINIAHNTHYSLFYILSSIWVGLFYYLGMKKARCGFESVYFYVCFPTLFLASLSTVRQSMAFAVIFYLICCYNERLLKRILLLVVAFCCHSSSIAALPLLFPLKHLSKRRLWMFFIASFVCGQMVTTILLNLAYNNPLIVHLQQYLSEEAQGGGIMRVFIYLLTVLTLIYFDQLNRSGMKMFAIYVCIGGCLYALFGANVHLGERFCTFYFSAIMIYIFQLRKCIKLPRIYYVTLLVVIFTGFLYIANINSRQCYTSHKDSLYYPYETIFGNL